MSSRSIAVLAMGALVATLLAWVLQPGPGPQEPGHKLLPALAGQLNDVQALVLEPAGGEPFRLERHVTGWRAPALGGYAVDAGEVRRLLLGLAEAQVVETKTSNPELHDRLGVEAHEGRPGSGVRLSMEGADGVPALLIGQRETRGLSGTYVRRAEEDTALLVDRDLQPPREPIEWLERELLDVPPEDIESLEIRRADGEILRIDRDELGIFRIANLPEGREPSGPTAAEATARALSALRLDDVRPLEGWEPATAPTLARFVLADGMIVEATTWQSLSPAEGTASWVAFNARAAGDSDDEVRARAQALNERLGSWRFRLPAWKHEQLTRRLEDLLVPAQS